MGLEQPESTGASTPATGGNRIILCADDFGLSEGVSRAIEELATARRLSATSVLVTAPQWSMAAPRLVTQRGHLAVGLHLDLTLGPPLGLMPKLAPTGSYPSLRDLATSALRFRVDAQEVGDEIERQLDRFEQTFTFPPDHIDAHQHVHVLPGIRRALLATVSRRYSGRFPLIRNPSDRLVSRASRGNARAKAMMVGMLATGFERAARRHGLPVNRGFSGFSRFDVREPYAHELRAAIAAPGPRHIVMCHPGHPDAELARRDPVVARRRMEYDVLMNDPDLPGRLWRPSRAFNGPPVDWSQV